jgi:capsular polysaccharide biosynthesis protein
MENKESRSSLNIITIIIQWWKTLLIVGVVAAIVSAGVSMLITPKYKSSVIMMPTASNAVSQMILVANNYNEFLDATQFGDDMKIDQMLQILNSREIKDHLIAKFNLRAHYGIDSTKKHWKTKLYEQVKNSCSFSRTDFMGIQVSVLDIDPQLAADMANEIADYYDILKRKIIKQRSEEAFVILQDEMDKYDELTAELADSLSTIMSYGIYDYESQSEGLIAQYAKDVANGNTAGVKRIKEELSVLEKWGPVYLAIRDRIFFLKRGQMTLQQQYQNMRVDADYNLSQKFVVEYAVPSDKKAYPKRSIIVIMSTFCSLSLALLLIVGKESFRRVYSSMRKNPSKNIPF